MRPPREDTQPWYKQFWPWFLISLPASVVVASMVTINLAITTSDGLVSDDYYKEGLAIRKFAEKSQLAQDLGLNGAMDYDSDTGAVSLALDGDLSPYPGTLELEVIHPTIPNQDQATSLTFSGGNRYVGRIDNLIPGNWRIRVKPTDDSWRIEGRMSIPAASTVSLN
jgi:uncharacterized protein